MVTHDAFSASYAKNVYILSDGAIKYKLNRSGRRKEFYDYIMEIQATLGESFEDENGGEF